MQQLSLLDVLDRPAPPVAVRRPPAVAAEAKSANNGTAPAPEPDTASARFRKHRMDGRDVVAVDPKRLQSGYFGEGKEGDVRKSYSAQALCEEGRIPTPFRLNGADWVQTGGHYSPDGNFFECFKVVPVDAFDGAHETYSERSERQWEAARNNPLGGYHGMSARHAGRIVVLQGPPIIVVAGETVQGALL